MKSTGPWLQKPLHATLSELSLSNQVPSSIHDSSNHSGEYNSLNHDTSNQYDDSASVSTSIRSTGIERYLTLFDLISIGVGGTIGSGIFVLNGFIAHNYAGPATSICWFISGLAACLSGVCYAELACRMPAAGSSYVYVYSSMGELPAVIVAGCLTLEYVVSAAAVARSWGDKVISWILMQLQSSQSDDAMKKNYDEDVFVLKILSPGYNFNPLSMLIATVAVILLLNGVKESKNVTNFFTMTKVAVVVFMAVVGLILMQPQENLKPFLPPEFGISGIFRGATSSFFGYIGFDEICCMAGEAKNPQRNMPLAIIFSLVGVSILYITAALALTGMQPYGDISDVSGFPVAFAYRGWDWAAQISAFGEVFTLPIVVLISLMAQPRLQYALSRDGLLPPIFGKVDAQGNFWFGTLISGLLMIIIASFVPFDHLNDMISAGILLAFCLTDSSLILMRTESPDTEPFKVERSLLVFNFASLLFGITMSHFFHFVLGKIILVLSFFQLFKSFRDLWIGCSPVVHFGGKTRKYYGDRCAEIEENAFFKTPLLPFVPCFGIFINWYLIGQLEVFGICLLLGFIFAVTLFYFGYSRHHSVGNNGGWNEDGTPRRMDPFATDHTDNFEASELMNNGYDDDNSPRKMLKSDSQKNISSRTRKMMLPPLA